MPYTDADLRESLRASLSGAERLRYDDAIREAQNNGLNEAKSHANGMSVLLKDAANISGPTHVDGNLGSALDQYPRKRKKGRDNWSVGKFAGQHVQTLYVNRPVLNGLDIHNWFKAQGFPTVYEPEQMHVTLVYSKVPFDISSLAPDQNPLVVPSVKAFDSHRFVVALGKEKEIAALKFDSPELGARWRQLIDAGASTDWPDFKAHISISLNPPVGFEANTKPWLGQIMLGPEVFDEVKEGDWKMNVVEKVLGASAGAGDWVDDFVHSDNPKFAGKSKQERIRMALGAYYANKRETVAISDDEVNLWVAKIGARHSKSDTAMIQQMHDNAVDLGASCDHETQDGGEVAKKYETTRIVKVDKSLGLVIGYAIICKIGGKDYYDKNIDVDGSRVPEHIPEDTMMKAAMDFMLHSRVGNELHAGPDKGTYAFAFPMTTDVAKSLGIDTPVTGLLVGYFPPKDVLAKFMDGTYKGFSIEGRRLKVEEHTE